MLKTWRAMTLWKRVFIGLFLGVLTGLGLHYGLGEELGGDIATTWFKPFGDGFVLQGKDHPARMDRCLRLGPVGSVDGCAGLISVGAMEATLIKVSVK